MDFTKYAGHNSKSERSDGQCVGALSGACEAHFNTSRPRGGRVWPMPSLGLIPSDPAEDVRFNLLNLIIVPTADLSAPTVACLQQTSLNKTNESEHTIRSQQIYQDVWQIFTHLKRDCFIILESKAREHLAVDVHMRRLPNIPVSLLCLMNLKECAENCKKLVRKYKGCLA